MTTSFLTPNPVDDSVPEEAGRADVNEFMFDYAATLARGEDHAYPDQVRHAETLRLMYDGNLAVLTPEEIEDERRRVSIYLELQAYVASAREEESETWAGTPTSPLTRFAIKRRLPVHDVLAIWYREDSAWARTIDHWRAFATLARQFIPGVDVLA